MDLFHISRQTTIGRIRRLPGLGLAVTEMSIRYAKSNSYQVNLAPRPSVAQQVIRDFDVGGPIPRPARIQLVYT